MPDKPRFLITTPDERTWRTDRPVLFLGEWCTHDVRKSFCTSLDAKIVPDYGWEKGQREADFAYTGDLCERLLDELGEALNRYHKTSHTRRYWRMLVGPWLSPFVAIVFNRWSVIQMALKEFEVSGAVVLDYPVAETIPNSTYDFPQRYLSHEWNHALIGRILTGSTDVKCETIPVESTMDDAILYSPPAAKSARKMFRNLIADAVVFFSKSFTRSTDAFFIGTYLPLVQDLRLQIALGQIPKRWQTPAIPRVRPDLEARRAFRLSSNGHQGLEQCIRSLIPEQLPSIYLEGYQILSKLASELPWPRRPSVIFTSNSFHADECFKAWAAAKVEEGVPYVIGQHGGYYGVGRYTTHSAINEYATADRFLTWGWKDDDVKKYPTAALILVGKTEKWRTRGDMLLQVTVRYFRYTRDPWSIFREYLDYSANQLDFASFLPGHIRTKLVVRFHPSSWSQGYPPEPAWRARHPDVKLDMGASSFESLIQQTRLSIATYNSTGFLQTLGRNMPTVMFWNPRYNELTPGAEPYFELLRKVGIFHASPESAAAKVAEVWNDVGAWWQEPELQAARRAFCECYARLPDKPIKVLRDALTSIRTQA